MDLQLQGKLALVSGSTAGIGNAIAAALAREGARVVINGRTEAAVTKAVQCLQAETGGEVQGFAGDLSTAAGAEAVMARFPAVDILVNNLGIFEPKPFEEILDGIDRVIENFQEFGQSFVGNATFQEPLRAYLQSIQHPSMGGSPMSRERTVEIRVRLVSTVQGLLRRAM